MTAVDVEGLFARVPEGWSSVVVDGRRYGLTRTVSAGGRIQKIYAEELGGTDVISANLYAGGRFRPCEMPAATVVRFLQRVVPDTATRRPDRRPGRRSSTRAASADGPSGERRR